MSYSPPRGGWSTGPQFGNATPEVTFNAWVRQGRRQPPNITPAKSIGSTAIDDLSGKVSAIIGAGLVAASTVAVADTRSRSSTARPRHTAFISASFETGAPARSMRMRKQRRRAVAQRDRFSGPKWVSPAHRGEMDRMHKSKELLGIPIRKIFGTFPNSFTTCRSPRARLHEWTVGLCHRSCNLSARQIHSGWSEHWKGAFGGKFLRWR